MQDETRVPPPTELPDLIQDAVFFVYEHGNIMHVSAGVEYLLGYKPSELVGGNMIDHIHPDDRGRTLNCVWQIMQGVSASRFRNRWMHKHGHPVDIEWAACWSAKHRVRVATARAAEK
jgi:PAS domain S-box-containing protein